MDDPVARGAAAAAAAARVATGGTLATAAPPIPDDEMSVRELQAFLGVTADGAFGPMSRQALFRRLSNTKAPALTDADFEWAAAELGVPVGHVRGVTEVETPRGSFDDQGRPTILYERHKFRNHTGGRFSAAHPELSGPQGGYGPYSAQYGKLARACALDPGAAFLACSWGAFQVLGENAVALGYPSALAMALEMVAGERAHLDSFVRFVRVNGLVDKLRACRPGDAASCIPFVERYNGPGFRRNAYHSKLAAAIR